MNSYLRNDESRPCVCGGKVALTPSLKRTHDGTLKHRNYEFMVLCVEFLECEDKTAKVVLLKRMKSLLVR